MQTLIDYLKNPTYCSNKKPKVAYFLFLAFIFFLGAISTNILIFIICKLFHIKHHEIGLTPLMTIIVSIIIAPIYEEIIFRSLLKFKKNNILIFTATVIAIIVFLIFRLKIVFAILLSILLLCLLSLLIIFSRSKIELFITSKFKYFFYASSIIFGLLHAFNFTGNIYLVLAFSFILGSPQIVGGFILGFIRMNYGLTYSILFHISVNIIMLFSLL